MCLVDQRPIYWPGEHGSISLAGSFDCVSCLLKEYLTYGIPIYITIQMYRQLVDSGELPQRPCSNTIVNF
jgi:hypothetical protein